MGEAETTTAAVAQLTAETVQIRDLLDAGLHFGHQTKRWNPKMKQYIFDKRQGIHLVDLSKTLVLLREALKFIRSTVASGKPVLLVGTKKQAQQAVKDAAVSCGQFYVTERWVGGCLTNRATVRRSVLRMRNLDKMEKDGTLASMNKKEASRLRHELERLRRNLTGIADMADLPGAIFVADILKDAIAVKEANKLGVPVVALVDTCCNPDPVDFVIPGNDDAIRAIKIIADLIAESVRRAQADYEKNRSEAALAKEQESLKADKAEPVGDAGHPAREDAGARRPSPGSRETDGRGRARPAGPRGGRRGPSAGAPRRGAGGRGAAGARGGRKGPQRSSESGGPAAAKSDGGKPSA